MSNERGLCGLMIGAILLVFPSTSEEQRWVEGALAEVTTINCTFTSMSVGTWDEAEVQAEVKPSDLVLQFEAINADEATAQMASDYGSYDIVVRYAEGYLHFIQSFLDGPLHVTTVLEEEARPGFLKAMHSRHEYTAFVLPGFTSSPEQYYGECAILD